MHVSKPFWLWIRSRLGRFGFGSTLAGVLLKTFALNSWRLYYRPISPTNKLLTRNHWVVRRRLASLVFGFSSSSSSSSSSIVGKCSGAAAVAFAWLWFAIMIAASDAAFFCASRASRVYFSNRFASSNSLWIFCGLCGRSWGCRLLCELVWRMYTLRLRLRLWLFDWHCAQLVIIQTDFSIVGEHCSEVFSHFASLLLDVSKSTCFAVISVAVANASNRPHFNAALPAKLDSSWLTM